MFLVLAPGSVRAETVSVELRFGGHLGGLTDGELRSVPKGSTRSYTVRLASWPAAVGTSVTVQIDKPSSGLAYLHTEQLVFTQSNHRKRQHVKVTGVTEGTVTIGHTIEGHPGALDSNPSSVTFKVAAGKSQECTYRAVKRHILQRPLESVFIPGKLDETCAVVSQFSNNNGDYTQYAYPFGAFEYVNDEARHYSWAMLIVDAEHNIEGVSMRLRDALHKAEHGQNTGLDISRYELIEPGETFWSYFAESRNLRKSACGFSALEALILYAHNLEGGENFDATSFGWDRGCLVDEGKSYQGITAAQPVSMPVTYQDIVYDILIDHVRIYAGSIKFVLSTDREKNTGYDNSDLIDVFPSGQANLNSGGALNYQSASDEYRIVFDGDDAPPTISRPSPFPLE